MAKYVDEDALFGSAEKVAKVQYVNEDDLWGADENIPTLKATSKRKPTPQAEDTLGEYNAPEAPLPRSELEAPPQQNESLLEDLGTATNIGSTVQLPEQVLGATRGITHSALFGGGGQPNAATRAADKYVFDPISRKLKERQDTLSEQYTPETKAAQKAQFTEVDPGFAQRQQDDFIETPETLRLGFIPGEASLNPAVGARKTVVSAVESAPSSLAMAAPTALVARQAGQLAFKEMLALTGDRMLAQKAAEVAAPRAAMIIGGITEGLQGAGAAYESALKEVDAVPIEELRKNENFIREFQSTPENLPQSERELIARDNLRHQFASISSSVAQAFDTVLGAAGDRYIGDAAIGKGRRTGSMFQGSVSETFTEAPQSGGEKLGENLGAKATIDPNRPVLQDVGEEALAGGLSGGLMGAGMGGILHQAPPRGPLSRAANIATDQAASQEPQESQAPPPGMPVEEPIPGVDHSVYTHIDQEGRPYRPLAPGGTLDGATEDYAPEWYPDRVYPRGWLFTDEEGLNAGSMPGSEEIVRGNDPGTDPGVSTIPDGITVGGAREEGAALAETQGYAPEPSPLEFAATEPATPNASAPASAPLGVTLPADQPGVGTVTPPISVDGSAAPVVSREQGVSETQSGLPITDESQIEPTNVAPVKHDLTGVKVKIKGLVDGKVAVAEMDAQTALDDINTEISLYEKLLNCVSK